MEEELRHVLDHPALGIQHWNTEIRSRFIEIMKIILNIGRMIELEGLTTRVKGKYGNHYKECVWSKPDVKFGPDTCVCCTMGVAKHTIGLLLEEITNITSNK